MININNKSWLVIIGLLLTLTVSNVCFGNQQTWLLVDVKQQTLTVVENGRLLERFKNISLGRGGVSVLRERGDGKTPLGQFQIAWVNRDSRYYLFFGLDFPNIDYAHRAFSSNLINSDEFTSIKAAFAEQRRPPQDTRLGGFIGIHGLGDSDPRVHANFNWTDGCVALTNQQIEQLAQWIDIGTHVIIF